MSFGTTRFTTPDKDMRSLPSFWAISCVSFDLVIALSIAIVYRFDLARRRAQAPA